MAPIIAYMQQVIAANKLKKIKKRKFWQTNSHLDYFHYEGESSKVKRNSDGAIIQQLRLGWIMKTITTTFIIYLRNILFIVRWLVVTSRTHHLTIGMET